MSNKLQDIVTEYRKNSQKVRGLLGKYVVITEQIQGARLMCQRVGDELSYFKKTNTEIDRVERSLMVFYESGIEYLDSISEATIKQMPENYVFNFLYFPSNSPVDIQYDRKPKNNLMLNSIFVKTDSGNIRKVITDTRVLNEWASKLNVNKPPVIFEGKLKDTQLNALHSMLSYDNFKGQFEDVTFCQKFLSIMNSALKSSILMNDLEKNVEGYVFKVVQPGKPSIHYKLNNPKLERVHKEKREASDIYQLTVLDIIEYAFKHDFEKSTLVEKDSDMRYIELMSDIFNKYIKENAHKFVGLEFEKPEFANSEVFNLNTKFITSIETRKYLENENLQDLYKIFLATFRKRRKSPTSLFTETTIQTINEIVDRIENKVTTMQKEDSLFTFKDWKNKVVNEGAIVSNTKPGRKKVNFFIGRFQPFTLGHAKVFKRLYEVNKLPVVVCLVRGSKPDPQRRPFDADIQQAMFAAMQKEYKFLEASFVIPNGFVGSVVDALRPAYEPVVWGTGTDRADSYQNMIDKYKDDMNTPEMAIEIIKRTDANISATKVRNALLINDEKTFKKMTPKSVHKFYEQLSTILQQLQESAQDSLIFSNFKAQYLNEDESGEKKGLDEILNESDTEDISPKSLLTETDESFKDEEFVFNDIELISESEDGEIIDLNEMMFMEEDIIEEDHYVYDSEEELNEAVSIPTPKDLANTLLSGRKFTDDVLQRVAVLLNIDPDAHNQMIELLVKENIPQKYAKVMTDEIHKYPEAKDFLEYLKNPTVSVEQLLDKKTNVTSIFVDQKKFATKMIDWLIHYRWQQSPIIGPAEIALAILLKDGTRPAKGQAGDLMVLNKPCEVKGDGGRLRGQHGFGNQKEFKTATVKALQEFARQYKVNEFIVPTKITGSHDKYYNFTRGNFGIEATIQAILKRSDLVNDQRRLSTKLISDVADVYVAGINAIHYGSDKTAIKNWVKRAINTDGSLRVPQFLRDYCIFSFEHYSRAEGFEYFIVVNKKGDAVAMRSADFGKNLGKTIAFGSPNYSERAGVQGSAFSVRIL